MPGVPLDRCTSQTPKIQLLNSYLLPVKALKRRIHKRAACVSSLSADALCQNLFSCPCLHLSRNFSQLSMSNPKCHTLEEESRHQFLSHADLCAGLIQRWGSSRVPGSPPTMLKQASVNEMLPVCHCTGAVAALRCPLRRLGSQVLRA